MVKPAGYPHMEDHAKTSSTPLSPHLLKQPRTSKVAFALLENPIIRKGNGNMRKKSNRVERRGKVAVAVSPGYGAGWTTWNRGISPFEPKIIKMIETGKRNEITEEWCKTELGLGNIYCGGTEKLEIVWLKKGTKFRMSEYDGSESLVIDSDLIHEA